MSSSYNKGGKNISFKKYKPEKLGPIELSILHKNILRVAYELKKKSYTLDTVTLFKACRQKLPNPEPEIDKAIRELIGMKYILEGKRLLKGDILANEKRRMIFEYILKNPGVHEREIRAVLRLGAYMAFRHLGFLVKFGFLREKSYLNKKVYFPTTLEESRETELLLLRNETTDKIYQFLKIEGRLQLVELEEKLEIPYATVQFHIKRLIEGELVRKIRDGSSYYYVPTVIPDNKSQIEVQSDVYYVGGKIIFKVLLHNIKEIAIYRIAVSINPSDQFIIDVTQLNLAELHPNTTNELDFTLRPLSCGSSKIFGSVSFEDAFGIQHLVAIPYKVVSIKCPLVIPKKASQAEVDEWINDLSKGTSNICFENISETDAFQIGREQVRTLDLSELNVNMEKRYGLYSGQVKVSGQIMVVKMSVTKNSINFDVWADDIKQTTGILAYITNLVDIALKTA